MKTANTLTPSLGDQFELTIDSLSYSGGRGVGRHEGLVVFVPHTAPKDRVLVRVTSQKARFLEAEVVELLEPSPMRRDPPCPIAGRCGGCTWQHVSYEEQVAQKDQILRHALKGLQKHSAFEWRSFVKAPQEFHYRNRIQVHFQGEQFGFYASGSRDLVPFEHCWIADSKINDRLKSLTVQDAKGTPRVELACTQEGEVAVMAGPRDPDLALFAQVNEPQNEKLKELVQGLISSQPNWIFDLYCGAGNFTLPLHQKFSNARIYGVEFSRSSIERAKLLNSAIHWLAGDVAKVLKKMDVIEGPGLVILDPPRAGCETRAIEQIVRHRPHQIVYISCNPMTFARDAEKFRLNNYHLESVQGVDMFPQTEHVELVASLRAAL